MTDRRLERAFSCVLLFVLVSGWLTPSAAFASVAQFRNEHGESLNNLQVTPGATFNVTIARICRPGYASNVRDVPESEKIAVYAEYGIAHHTTDEYEIDHLISLELGGSNAITNLWPELNDHPHGYLNSKDILENRLHHLVCDGSVTLALAQRSIATDWVSAYRRYLGGWPSAKASLAPAPSTAPGTTATGPAFPHSALVKITSLSNPVAPGDYATLTARSTPNDVCTLSVTLPSGNVSRSSGLGSATINASGIATWRWKIDISTGAGSAHAVVSCGAGSTSASFTIA